MEGQKEAYYLKVNSMKEVIKALNDLEFGEEEKVAAVALGILLYDIFKSVAKVIKSSTFIEASDETLKACLLIKTEEVLQKYITKEKGRKTISPDWAGVMMEVYYSFEANVKEKMKR